MRRCSKPRRFLQVASFEPQRPGRALAARLLSQACPSSGQQVKESAVCELPPSRLAVRRRSSRRGDGGSRRRGAGCAAGDAPGRRDQPGRGPADRAPRRRALRHRATLHALARGRRGRLPARARDPPHQGAGPARAGAAPVDAHGRQARGVRDLAQSGPHGDPARRGVGARAGAHAAARRAGRELRAVARRRRGDSAAEATGGALPRAARRGALLPPDLPDHRLDVHEREPSGSVGSHLGARSAIPSGATTRRPVASIPGASSHGSRSTNFAPRHP